jgi:cyclopropane fatty-acyl-phospholipid synthase-like methyltransferase
MCNIKVVTNFPIAFDSPDHLIPLGTKLDDSHNIRFVKCCEKWLKNKKGSILDIGCSGGGCVEDFIKRGHNAIGIEGSDYSKKIGRASWNNIPDRLFTADASRPFLVLLDNSVLKFDIIISFEVMEHIPLDRLHQYFENIKNHLSETGFFVGSFTTTKSKKYPEHHQSIMTKKKWYEFIDQLGWFNIFDLKWRKKDYLRYSKLAANCIPISFKLT